MATILNFTLALTSSGWDGAPLNRAFYPTAMLSVAAVLALLTLATRFDVVYPSVFCWATVAIASDDMANRAAVAFSLVGVVGSLVLIVLVRHLVQLCREGRQGIPPPIWPGLKTLPPSSSFVSRIVSCSADFLHTEFSFHCGLQTQGARGESR